MLLSFNSFTIYQNEGGTVVYKVTRGPDLSAVVWKLVHFDLTLSTPEAMLWEERHFLDHGPRVWRMMGDSCEEGGIFEEPRDALHFVDGTTGQEHFTKIAEVSESHIAFEGLKFDVRLSWEGSGLYIYLKPEKTLGDSSVLIGHCDLHHGRVEASEDYMDMVVAAVVYALRYKRESVPSRLPTITSSSIREC